MIRTMIIVRISGPNWRADSDRRSMMLGMNSVGLSPRFRPVMYATGRAAS
ncbi:hypothetical protein Asphe3_42110 (plasmid) [Pseudarthrobacter phenanthrenivorans Sphe3]|uniref:Uncharacterized protein n=1 Tax=Pseudarthrobacter phenanthrenivorans (strain DSM 18606 / JCM 16027 / LMG 23796 / Sphe3) TaxID=930171 RepID=F0MCM0_PSEPM|nr:hypothetical protein Asphe3_42110 [Pseudarthrobacter phenanthrenivorans Sphe3]